MQYTKLAFFTLNVLNVRSFNYLLAKYVPKTGERLFLFLDIKLFSILVENQANTFLS